MIGLEIGVFKSVINSELSNYEKIELDYGLKEILDYDDLGIQVFIKDGLVVSITCSGK